MTEAMIIEAVRSAGTASGAGLVQQAAAIDPAAVAKFQEAMQPQGVSEIPFAREVSGTWQAVQDNHQEMLHRIHALTAMSKGHALSAAELSELQYEVANLSFQQEVVTNIAKKASDAVTTLVKNG